MKGITSELMSVKTSSGFDYIASVCQNCNIIGTLKQFHNRYFCSKKCQKEYAQKRFKNQKQGEEDKEEK